MVCASCGAQAPAASRFCPMCGSPLQAQAVVQEARKSVTILFIDLVGSTTLAERLDPEPLRQLIDRYFAVCRSAIVEHGGEVEKFIGDAVMAVFGATIAHEDDAIRAVRAAADALVGLENLNADIAVTHQVNLAARCGICSGEVVVITAPAGSFRVVGDAVNTASRLQTEAAPGEILIGAQTAALARGHAHIEQIPPLHLKGKAEAVPVWRVVDPVAHPGGTPPLRTVPLIGRDDELTELRQSFRRVIRRRQVCLVTVLGAPGIGKSRLVSEFLAGLGEDEATVMSGRCSAYGKGITYAPLAEMLSTGPGGWAGLARLLSEDSGMGRRAAYSLATIMGHPGPGTPPSTGTEDLPGSVGIEEIAWSVRYVLDILGQDRPVVMVWEDLHWAEETLLDLIDEVAAWLTDVPVLLLCLARTELLESRPSWGGGKPCAMTLELGPLSFEHSGALVSELALQAEVYAQEQHEVLAHVAAHCDGNPLFAELMLDVFPQMAPGARMPPTIAALLSARLDQLPADERQLLEMAAAIGRDFGSRALEAVAAAEGTAVGTVGGLTTRLVRKRVIQRAGPGSFRFAQTLLRDAAYSSTPKARRERWHTFLAQWFADRPHDLGQSGHRDGFPPFAHHAEAACLLRRDLLPGSPAPAPLALAAADALIAEGMSALTRKDLPAAATLLERGRDLLPAGDARHASLALHICDSWIGLWDEQRATAALAAAEEALQGDQRTRVMCAIQRCIIAIRFGLADPGTVAAQMRQMAADLDSGLGDDLIWCRYHQAQAYLHLASERAASADAAWRLGLARAQAMADAYEEERLLCAICEMAQWTPTSAAEGLKLCAVLTRRFAANRVLLVPVLVTQAYLEAISGRLDAARQTVDSALTYSTDLHLDRADAAVLETSAIVESLAGAHDKAETRYRQAAAALRAAYESPDVRVLDVATARELFEQNKAAEAAALLGTLGEADVSLSLRTQIVTTALRGRIGSQRGAHELALNLARRAAELADGVDDPCLAGDALFDLAIVARAAGQAGEAATAGAAALRRFEAKGAAWRAGQVRAWLSSLNGGADD